MGPWKDHDATHADSTCTACGREVSVNAAPAPNEIDIGGEAVSVGCKE